MSRYKDVYIDWDKVPEGTTHLLNPWVWENGAPPRANQYYEKWVGAVIYEWDDNQWVRYSDMTSIDMESRVPVTEFTRPKQLHVKTGKDLFGYKFRVTSALSAWIQQMVFEAGGGWKHSREICNLVRKYLFVSEDGVITYAIDVASFNLDHRPEATITLSATLEVKDKPAVEMTHKQICEALGKNIKIVKEPS